MSLTIWITGATGFSAGHLAAELRRTEPDARLIGLARRPDPVEGFDTWHQADVTDFAALQRAVVSDPPDQVYHLAGAVPPSGEEELWFVNAAATRLMIEAIAKPGRSSCRILITSSAAVYQPSPTKVNEQSPAGGFKAYGRSKWAQEQIAFAAGREFGVEVVVARAFNLLGPGLPERLLAGAVCARCAKSTNGRIETGDLSAARDFVDIRDACEAYTLLMDAGETGGVYNVSSGEATPVRTLVGTLAALAGGLEVDEERADGQGGVELSFGDSTKLESLGWMPSRTLHDSLKDMLDCHAGLRSRTLPKSEVI